VKRPARDGGAFRIETWQELFTLTIPPVGLEQRLCGSVFLSVLFCAAMTTAPSADCAAFVDTQCPIAQACDGTKGACLVVVCHPANAGQAQIGVPLPSGSGIEGPEVVMLDIHPDAIA
jgi:hypothetical protein